MTTIEVTQEDFGKVLTVPIVVEVEIFTTKTMPQCSIDEMILNIKKDLKVNRTTWTAIGRIDAVGKVKTN